MKKTTLLALCTLFISYTLCQSPEETAFEYGKKIGQDVAESEEFLIAIEHLDKAGPALLKIAGKAAEKRNITIDEFSNSKELWPAIEEECYQGDNDACRLRIIMLSIAMKIRGSEFAEIDYQTIKAQMKINKAKKKEKTRREVEARRMAEKLNKKYASKDSAK